mmetsp:Transcript_13848/g.44383  ORF Transcript_13848/g.44383 Transcript_13848/m.44383 type:complete len:570 (-) Transcript_13848:1849-3558(-)
MPSSAIRSHSSLHPSTRAASKGALPPAAAAHKWCTAQRTKKELGGALPRLPRTKLSSSSSSSRSPSGEGALGRRADVPAMSDTAVRAAGGTGCGWRVGGAGTSVATGASDASDPAAPMGGPVAPGARLSPGARGPPTPSRASAGTSARAATAAHAPTRCGGATLSLWLSWSSAPNASRRRASGSAVRSGSSTHAVKVGLPIDSAKYRSRTRRTSDITSVSVSSPSRSEPLHAPPPPAPPPLPAALPAPAPPPHQTSSNASRARATAASRHGESGRANTCSPRQRRRERGTHRRGARPPPGLLRPPPPVLLSTLPAVLLSASPAVRSAPHSAVLHAHSQPRAARSCASIASSSTVPRASIPYVKAGVASQSVGRGRQERSGDGRSEASVSVRPSTRAWASAWAVADERRRRWMKVGSRAGRRDDAASEGADGGTDDGGAGLGRPRVEAAGAPPTQHMVGCTPPAAATANAPPARSTHRGLRSIALTCPWAKTSSPGRIHDRPHATSCRNKRASEARAAARAAAGTEAAAAVKAVMAATWVVAAMAAEARRGQALAEAAVEGAALVALEAP